MANPRTTPTKALNPTKQRMLPQLTALMLDHFVHVHIADLLQRSWIHLQQLHLLSASTAELQMQVA